MQFGDRKNQRNFAEVPDISKPRSTFNRSFEVHDTYQFDYVNTLFTDICIPGDTINMNARLFARLTTQLKPLMDRLYASVDWFWIPDRLVFTHQKEMFGHQENPGDSISYINPQMTAPAVTGFLVGSEMDKAGIPTGVPGLVVKNTKPLRAKIRVYNDWYRDENLNNSIPLPMGDGPDVYTDFPAFKHAKAHDYFTSGLPWAQKGAAVTMSLGSSAPVISTGDGKPVFNNAGQNLQLLAQNASQPTLWSAVVSGASGSPAWSDTKLIADLTNATSSTINALRQSFLMQEFLEMDARGGTRYVETIPNHFGVTLPDFTAQRSEYLGGGHFDFNINPVAQTSATSGANKQGDLAAFGTLNVGADKRLGFTKSFHEWGTVLGLITFRAAITYQQGLNRFWSYSTRFDYPWPVFSNLGEQSTYNNEIYAVGSAAATDFLTFNYQERYAEAKFRPSEIRGEFRSTYATSLDVYHQAEKFTALPAFNASFIASNTPIDRILAVSSATTAPVQLDAYFDYTHSRVLPVHNIPARLGKF